MNTFGGKLNANKQVLNVPRGYANRPVVLFIFASNLPTFYNRYMDKQPPEQPPADQSDAKILPFPDRRNEADRSRDRHPARGKETVKETLARLGLDNTPEDPTTLDN